jgi:NADP-dependent 3-hydroxy acid dehydrogenase YdfG
MKVRLKKLRDQVLVITGASSGIGLFAGAHPAAHAAGSPGLIARPRAKKRATLT